MLSIFKSKQEQPAKPAREYAPGTEISYDPKLIIAFKAQHKVLVDQLTATLKAAKSGRLTDVQAGLKSFRAELQDHLIQENLRLYTYLTYCMKGEDNKELMGEMRNEMGAIGRTVMRFLRHYMEFPVTPQNVDVFVKEAEQLANILLDRIRREETTLYTLYIPPSQF